MAVFPEGRTYDIGTATISVKLPPGTRVLRPPSFESPGWDWGTNDGGLVGRKSNVGRTEPAVLSIELALDAVPMLESHWQRRALLGRELTPAFIAAALFIIVTAGGILYAIRLQYFRKPVDTDAARRPEVAKGLRTAGTVVIIFGVVVAAAAYALLRSLGPWTQAVPASIVLVGVVVRSCGLLVFQPIAALRDTSGDSCRTSSVSSRASGSERRRATLSSSERSLRIPAFL